MVGKPSVKADTETGHGFSSNGVGYQRRIGDDLIARFNQFFANILILAFPQRRLEVARCKHGVLAKEDRVGDEALNFVHVLSVIQMLPEKVPASPPAESVEQLLVIFYSSENRGNGWFLKMFNCKSGEMGRKNVC